MKRFLFAFAVAFMVCIFSATGAFAYNISIDPATNLAGKWEPGTNSALFFNPGSAQQNGPGTPGAATWSIMAPDIIITFGDVWDPNYVPPRLGFHSYNDQSSNFSNLVSGAADGYEINVVNQALNQWASVSGFTNLGQVNDGGSWNGDSDANGGHLGDIRIGAYPFELYVNEDTGIKDQIVNAHTLYNPATNSEFQFGTIGGDIHFNDDTNGAIPNQVEWVDNEFDVSGNGQYDFYTVVLHELGHALGLGHSDDPNSVMALYNDRGGALRTLTDDDIAGIQAIYGAADPGDVDTTLPSCELTAENPGQPPGQPVSIEITVQDDESGLDVINVLVDNNATVTIPPFDMGTNDFVVITAESDDPGAESTVQLEITDVADNITVCEHIFNEQVPQTALINDSLTLGSLSTTHNPTPAPNAPAGVFTISATFSNVSASEITEMFFEVASLTGGNLVLNADGGPGGAGAKVSVPPGDLGADGILSPGESFTIDFEIGLDERRPFSFFVDAYGIIGIVPP